VFSEWIPRNVLVPLEAELLAEVKENGNWRNGFADGWLDTGKRYLYAFSEQVAIFLYANREFVPQTELPDRIQVGEMLSPKWRGKVAWDDPTNLGQGTQTVAIMLEAGGEELVRTFFREQSPMITKDLRQLTEWNVRGTRPLSVGISTSLLTPFKEQGLGLQVTPVRLDMGGGTEPSGPGFSTVAVFDGRPHPQAAKLFVNWLFSQPGQAAYNAKTLTNSRRRDVPPAVPDTAPLEGVAQVNFQSEAMVPVRERATLLAREIVQ
jgi:ABC-type Fe3+ transport system substrate-binding protein